MIYVLIGLCALAIAIFGSMIGIGGGVFMIPLLTLVFGMPMKVTVSAVLFAMVPYSFLASYMNFRNNLIEFKIGITLAIPTAIGAYFGGLLCAYMDQNTLKMIFGVIVTFAGMLMVREGGKILKTLGRWLKKANTKLVITKFDRNGKTVPIGAIVVLIFGGFTGVMAGLLGVGGGWMQTPLMVLLFQLLPSQAVATSIFIITLTSISGAVSHVLNGQVDWVLSIVVFVCFPGGAFLGTYLLPRIKESSIKNMIGIGVSLAGLAMLISTFFPHFSQKQSRLERRSEVKAVRVHEHGGPEVLTLDEIPRPEPERGEVLIEIKAVALNHLDIFVRRGIPGMELPLPIIPGSDIAGQVVEVGEDVEANLKGQRVLVNPGYGCGHCRYCLEGEVSLCSKYHIIGEMGDGGYTEYIAVDQHQVLPMPEGATYEEAAAFPLVFLTAWRMMVRKGQVAPQEDVLVLGGGGGVGMAVIQICKLHNARVIATASTERKLEKLVELGADETINYVEEANWHKKVRNLTGGKGADLVVDYIGHETWVKSLKSLRQGGRLVTCGATTGFNPPTDLRHIFFRQLTIMGSTMGNQNDLRQAMEAWKGGHVKPVIDSVLPLAQASEAHKMIEDRKVFGKLVLKVGS